MEEVIHLEVTHFHECEVYFKMCLLVSLTNEFKDTKGGTEQIGLSFWVEDFDHLGETWGGAWFSTESQGLKLRGETVHVFAHSW